MVFNNSLESIPRHLDSVIQRFLLLGISTTLAATGDISTTSSPGASFPTSYARIVGRQIFIIGLIFLRDILHSFSPLLFTCILKRNMNSGRFPGYYELVGRGICFGGCDVVFGS